MSPDLRGDGTRADWKIQWIWILGRVLESSGVIKPGPAAVSDMRIHAWERHIIFSTIVAQRRVQVPTAEGSHDAASRWLRSWKAQSRLRGSESHDEDVRCRNLLVTNRVADDNVKRRAGCRLDWTGFDVMDVTRPLDRVWH